MPSALPFPTYTDVRFFYGDAQIPREVKNLRQSTMGAMRRVGTPVLLKRMYTTRDADEGTAVPSPARDPIYKQPPHADPLSHGVGYVSAETQPGEWYDPSTFEIVTGDIDGPIPRDGLLPAPKYRGYGPGFLTYVILPDRPEDVYKLGPGGVLTRTQNAKLQLPWWPVVGDNDIMITCRLGNDGRIIETYERYQLKMVQPITMRGTDRRGAREIEGTLAGGNRHWVGQECEATKVPEFDPIYQVETDR